MPTLLAGLARLLEYGNETDFTRSSLYENAVCGRSANEDGFCNTSDCEVVVFEFRSPVNLCSPALWLHLGRVGG